MRLVRAPTLEWLGVVLVVAGACGGRTIPPDRSASGDAVSVDGAADAAADTGPDATVDIRDDVGPGDAPVDFQRLDRIPSCGECADGRTCCPSPFRGDPGRCVNLQLNPEHCGRCGAPCMGPGRACKDGTCVEVPKTCSPDGGAEQCGEGFYCSGIKARSCCPDGTTYRMSIADFWGCCPDTDFCGCEGSNPTTICPTSRRRYKREIAYLDGDQLESARRALLGIRLAEYRYRHAPEAKHLGFIIDDLEPAAARACVAPDGEHVDLYGYTSLAVAAIQVQARQIDELRRELADLRRTLAELRGRPRRTQPSFAHKPR